MSTESEVIIIGCGILGASAAYSLLKSNVSTTILEQYSTHFHQFGASFGQGRIWRVAYANPIYANMMTKSIEIWKEIENITSTKLLSHCGGLDFSDKNSQSLKDVINTLKKNNFKFEILSSQQTNKRFNPIKLPSNYYSIYIPNDYGTIYADKALNGMVECIQNLNGTINYNTKVIRIEINNHNTHKYKYNVYTNNSTVYETNNVIYTCGAYKLPPIINKDKDKKDYNYKVIKRINDSIGTIELNVAYIKPSDDWMNICEYPSWVEYESNGHGWYGLITKQHTPFGNVYCMKIGEHLPNEQKDEGCPYERIMEYVKKRFVGEWDVFAFKKGYISYNKSQNEDDLTIDRIMEDESLFIMNGHSHGFKHAPEMGNIVKELVIDGKKPHKSFRLSLCQESKL